MSLGVVIKGPEGVVLAADSRVTLEARHGDGRTVLVNFDNATKLLTFGEPHDHVAAVTYGAAVIGLRTAHSFIPEFEPTLPKKRLKVSDYARVLSDFFLENWKKMPPPPGYVGQGMSFIVGGYDLGEPYGAVYDFVIPGKPEPNPRNPEDFGMTWGGQLEVANRLIHGYDPQLLQVLEQQFGFSAEKLKELAAALQVQLQFKIPYQVLALQDCIDLATFLVRTTSIAQTMAVGVRGVGGPIDVAYITRTSGVAYAQQKLIHGES